jgi:ABC-type amino acid transport substrate-binding protein
MRRTVAVAVVITCAVSIVFAQPKPPRPSSRVAAPPRTTFERLKAGGLLRLAYRTAARPLSFKDEAGRAAGFAVMLCQAIVEAVRREPGLAGVRVDWVPVTAETRFTEFEQGQYDLLCGATTVSLERRERMSFSIPIFAGGIGAVLRADAADVFRTGLAGQAQTFQPIWESAVRQALEGHTFAAGASTTAEAWLNARVREAGLTATVVSVVNYELGVQALVDRKVDAVFGERAVLLDAVRRHPSAGELHFVERFFTYEPLALAMARGDDDLRLLVDRTLSRLYRSGDVNALYAGWFGPPDHATVDFYRALAIPE